MDQFITAYLLIGCLVSYGVLHDDRDLSKPHWLLALVMVAMAWIPFVAIIVIQSMRKTHDRG